MGRYEVTFDDYKRFTDDSAAQTLPDDQGWGRDSRPVIDVHWVEARAYAAWLSAQTGKTYRLPTEAEWEYAARAGTTSRYSWGNSANCSQANYGRSLGGSCNSGNNPSLARTVAVGRFAANPFGLYDMHGNVWEWVEDCFASTYTGAPTDGSARTTGCTILGVRTVRDGSWGNTADDMRSARRFIATTNRRSNVLGFRLVQELSP